VPEVYDRLAEELAANAPAALATAITGDLAGAKLLLPGTGAPQGSIHPALDARIAADARELLDAGQNESRFYELDGTPVEVFIETFPRAQRLIIVGAVHVAIPLHRLAKTLGYHVTVVDARGMLATPERFPEADAILTDWPDEALAKLAPDSATSVVVLTHDPKFDQPALLAALATPARYIGAIGSRTTNEQRRAELREQGVDDEALARIFAPIGLDLGAETPAEIALAIMAEIVAARQHRHGGHLRTAGLPVLVTVNSEQ
jgi:xanthine dehydrogenase accessory factor